MNHLLLRQPCLHCLRRICLLFLRRHCLWVHPRLRVVFSLRIRNNLALPCVNFTQWLQLLKVSLIIFVILAFDCSAIILESCNALTMATVAALNWECYFKNCLSCSIAVMLTLLPVTYKALTMCLLIGYRVCHLVTTGDCALMCLILFKVFPVLLLLTDLPLLLLRYCLNTTPCSLKIIHMVWMHLHNWTTTMKLTLLTLHFL